MIRAAQAAYFVALSLWVGGMAALAFIVAPSVFQAAPSRPAAGAIFGAVLRRFAIVELVCAAIVAVAAAVLQARFGGSAGVARLCLIALMILLLVVHVFGVAPQVAQERERIAGFDTLAEHDPQKAKFDRLHRWSVRLFGANIVLGLALVVLSAATLGSPSRSG